MSAILIVAGAFTALVIVGAWAKWDRLAYYYEGKWWSPLGWLIMALLWGLVTVVTTGIKRTPMLLAWAALGAVLFAGFWVATLLSAATVAGADLVADTGFGFDQNFVSWGLEALVVATASMLVLMLASKWLWRLSPIWMPIIMSVYAYYYGGQEYVNLFWAAGLVVGAGSAALGLEAAMLGFTKDVALAILPVNRTLSSIAGAALYPLGPVQAMFTVIAVVGFQGQPMVVVLLGAYFAGKLVGWLCGYLTNPIYEIIHG